MKSQIKIFTRSSKKQEMLKSYDELSICVFLCESVQDIDNYYKRIAEDFTRFCHVKGFEGLFDDLLAKTYSQFTYILNTNFKTI